MKKKKKKTSKRQPKIDVVLESLLNLERVSKVILKKLETIDTKETWINCECYTCSEPIKCSR
jgi:hypothetical protein